MVFEVQDTAPEGTGTMIVKDALCESRGVGSGEQVPATSHTMGPRTEKKSAEVPRLCFCPKQEEGELEQGKRELEQEAMSPLKQLVVCACP